MQNFRAPGAPPPDPRASGGWGLYPQNPRLRQLGAPPPDPQTAPPIANFWLRACTCPPVYHTLRRLHTVPLIAERQAGKL